MKTVHLLSSLKSCCLNLSFHGDQERVVEVLSGTMLFLLRHGVMPGLHWVLIFPGLAGHIKTPLNLTLLPTLGHLLPHCSPLEYFKTWDVRGGMAQLPAINNTVLQSYKCRRSSGASEPGKLQKTGNFYFLKTARQRLIDSIPQSTVHWKYWYPH